MRFRFRPLVNADPDPTFGVDMVTVQTPKMLFILLNCFKGFFCRFSLSRKEKSCKCFLKKRDLERVKVKFSIEERQIQHVNTCKLSETIG